MTATKKVKAVKPVCGDLSEQQAPAPDGARCIKCGKPAWTNEAGVCGECEQPDKAAVRPSTSSKHDVVLSQSHYAALVACVKRAIEREGLNTEPATLASLTFDSLMANYQIRESEARYISDCAAALASVRQ